MSESDKDQWRDLLAIFEDAHIAAYRFVRALNYARDALNAKEVQPLDDQPKV